MPAYSKDRENYFKSRIRGILLFRPKATDLEIQEILVNSSQPIELTRQYIAKLRNKILGERARHVENLNKNVRLAEIEEITKEVSLRAWTIANTPAAKNTDKIAAFKTILDAEYRLFEAQQIAGAFDRPTAPKKYEVSPERLAAMITTARNNGYHVDDNYRLLPCDHAIGNSSKSAYDETTNE